MMFSIFYLLLITHCSNTSWWYLLLSAADRVAFCLRLLNGPAPYFCHHLIVGSWSLLNPKIIWDPIFANTARIRHYLWLKIWFIRQPNTVRDSSLFHVGFKFQESSPFFLVLLFLLLDLLWRPLFLKWIPKLKTPTVLSWPEVPQGHSSMVVVSNGCSSFHPPRQYLRCPKSSASVLSLSSLLLLSSPPSSSAMIPYCTFN